MREEPKGKADVILCSMPFGVLPTPSLALSLLKASLANTHVHTKVLYLSILFAKMLGFNTYQEISNRLVFSGYHETGEWIFSESLFKDVDLDPKQYIETILRKPPLAKRRFLFPLSEGFIKMALETRRQVERFLERCIDEVDRYAPRIVGFSCLFQQRMASLSLAKRIKDRAPETFILFGGSDCEGIKGVELVRQFPFVDAVVSGQGDVVFQEIVKRILRGDPVTGLKGVYTKDKMPANVATSNFQNAAPPLNLDELPFPDFDDYFEQLELSGFSLPAPVYLSLETSRGCWWGEKSQCTFCNINGTSLTYSSKSYLRVLNELEYFSRKYPGKRIVMTDSNLNMKYFEDVIPELAKRRLGIHVQYETRSTLKKDQIQALQKAGITRIQPGIESLSSSILRLMRKGTTALQNVQCLKWCRELRIYTDWNMLWGFPCESTDAYVHMANLIPKLSHLQPPQSTRLIYIGRFSTLFEQSEELGLTNLVPSPAYDYIFPFKPDIVANLATYFTYSYRSPQNVEEYTQSIREAIQTWRNVYTDSELFSIDDGTRLLIWDQRPIAQEKLTLFAGLQRILYLACDGIQSLRQIRKAAEDYTGKESSEEEVEQILQAMEHRYLMIREGNKFLSLAIPVVKFSDQREIHKKIQQYLRALEEKKQLKALHARIKLTELPKAVNIRSCEINRFIKLNNINKK